MRTTTITGHDAIDLAVRDGLTIRKFADPTEGAREISVSEAETIAQEDSSLVYVEVLALTNGCRAEVLVNGEWLACEARPVPGAPSVPGASAAPTGAWFARLHGASGLRALELGAPRDVGNGGPSLSSPSGFLTVFGCPIRAVKAR